MSDLLRIRIELEEELNAYLKKLTIVHFSYTLEILERINVRR